MKINNKMAFVWKQGFDIIGNDISQDVQNKDNITGLINTCLKTDKCVAFNTNGWLKSDKSNLTVWENATENQGVFIKITNMSVDIEIPLKFDVPFQFEN